MILRDTRRRSRENVCVPPYAKALRFTIAALLLCAPFAMSCGANVSGLAEEPAPGVSGFPNIPLTLSGAPHLSRFVSGMRERETLSLFIGPTQAYPAWVEARLSPYLANTTSLRALGFRAVRHARGRPLDEQAVAAGLLAHLLHTAAGDLDALEPPASFASHRDELRATSAGLRQEATQFFERCQTLSGQAGSHMHAIAGFCGEQGSS